MTPPLHPESAATDRSIDGASGDDASGGFDPRLNAAGEPVLRAFFETPLVGMVEAEWSTGRVCKANRRFCEIAGRAAQDLIGLSIWELIHPDDRLRERDFDARVLSGDIQAYEIEKRYVRPDGTVAWVHASVMVVRDDQGTPRSTARIVQDISGRKRAEETLQRAFEKNKQVEAELRSSEERLRVNEAAARRHLAELDNIYKSAPIGLCVLDTQLQYVRINNLMAEMNGVPAAEHAGRSVAEIVPDLAAKIEGVLRQVLDTRMPVLEHEVSGVTPAMPGAVRYWLESYLPIIDENLAVTGINVTSVEITHRKRADEERRALLDAERAARGEAERINRMKDEFLATVSHELRTPLNAIVGWTRLLARGGAGDSRRALDIIDRNASSLTQIVEDLLDTSSIISGKIRLKQREIHLPQLIRTTMQGVQMAAEAKSIYLNASFDPDLRPLSGDPARIQQIVWNLLTNAIKFTPAGGQVSIAVSQAPDAVEIAVADNGEGIPAEFLPSLFTRFHQADASITRKHGGLGLGLAISRHLVELHGGTICAESRGVGRGAVFRIRLPSGEPVGGGGRSSRVVEPGSPSAPGSLDGVSILVVDDDEDGARLVARILEDSGARVQMAHSAADGFRMVTEFRPELLVSDISMPDEDGYSFIRRIRACGDWAATMGCLAITALARPEDRAKAVQAGYDDHLAKPFDAVHLVTTAVRLAGRVHERKPAASEPRPPSRSPAHILVVDDNESLAEMMRQLLESSGYEVSTAGTVAGAAEISDTHDIDLVISDLQLPDGTGWDLMSRVQRKGPVQGIMLSGYAGQEFLDRSEEAGFAEHLVKPVDDQHLLRSIERLVSRGRPETLTRS